jgi:predicted MFS family arabinose efflux permease
MDLGISSSFWLVFVSFMTYIYEATHSIFLLSILIFIKNLALTIVFLLLNYIDTKLYFRKIINTNYIILIFVTLLAVFTNSTNNLVFIFILFVIFEIVFMIHSILKYNLVIFIENRKVELINLMYEISYSVFMILGAIYAIFLVNVSLATYLLTLTLIALSFLFFNRIGFINIHFDGSTMQYENRFGKLIMLLLLADFMIALGENIAYILLPPIANSYVFVSEQGLSISLLIFGIGSLIASALLLAYPKLILRNQLWILNFVIYSLFPVFLLLSITIESHSLLIFMMCNALAGFANSFLMLFFTSLYQRIGREEFKRIYGIAYLLISVAAGISTLVVGFAYESLGIYKTLLFSTILLILALPILVSLNTHYRRLVLADIDIKELKEEIYKGYFKI